MPPRRILRRGSHSCTWASSPLKAKREHLKSSKSSPQQCQAIQSEEEVNSSTPSRHASKKGRDRDQEIDQLRKDIRSLGETMRNYMADNSRPQGSRCHNHPYKAQPMTTRDPTTDTHQEVEATKSNDETWSLQHTSDSNDSPKESLIPSHLLSRSVRSRYDEEGSEVEELKSTTDLRIRLEERREIKRLNRQLQEEEGRGEVYLRDKLTKQREIAEMVKKWEEM